MISKSVYNIPPFEIAPCNLIRRKVYKKNTQVDVNGPGPWIGAAPKVEVGYTNGK